MQSITFTPIVPAAQRRSDGSYNVKIRVTFRRKSRWIPTNVSVTDGQLTRAKKVKDPAVKTKLDELVGELREAVADMSIWPNENMDVDDVVRYIRKKKAAEAFKLDFFQFGRSYAETQSPSVKAQTVSALGALGRFAGAELDVNAITANFLRAFVDFINAEPVISYNRYKKTYTQSKKPKNENAAAKNYLSWLSRVFSAAKEKYNDEDEGIILIPRSPFERVEVKPPVRHGQKNLGVELMQRIISARPDDEDQQWALDVFVLSFGTMGANVADLFAAAPPVDGIWTYERQKTRDRRRDRALMRVAIPPQLGAVLGRLKDRPGSGLWLNLRRKCGSARNTTVQLNRFLREWATANEVEEFTMYAARHSWASIARSKAVGVDKATVDECLNHVGTMAMADIYIEKDFAVFDEANANVLKLFEWD